MALIKSITNHQGVIYDYHRLGAWNVQYNIDHTLEVRGSICSYVSSDICKAGHNPVKQTVFTVTVPEGTAVTQAYLYDQIQQTPEWSEATSDITT